MSTPRSAGDDCEYDPDAGRAAFAGEQHGPAEFVVGAKGEWRLCASCAALPAFKRFRVRTPITGQPTVATTLDVDGEPARVHGDRKLTRKDKSAIATVIRAARLHAAENQTDEQRAAYAAALQRNHDRNARVMRNSRRPR